MTRALFDSYRLLTHTHTHMPIYRLDRHLLNKLRIEPNTITSNIRDPRLIMSNDPTITKVMDLAVFAISIGD